MQREAKGTHLGGGNVLPQSDSRSGNCAEECGQCGCGCLRGSAGSVLAAREKGARAADNESRLDAFNSFSPAAPSKVPVTPLSPWH